MDILVTSPLHIAQCDLTNDIYFAGISFIKKVYASDNNTSIYEKHISYTMDVHEYTQFPW